MKRKLDARLVLLAVNLPLVVMWLCLASRPEQSGRLVPTLFVLLILGTIGMVFLPCILVSGLFARRWLLILMLWFVNAYWCLRWIDVYRAEDLAPAAYRWAQVLIPALIVLSSGFTVALYWLFGRILTFLRRRVRERTAGS
jgi:hypothetical protein